MFEYEYELEGKTPLHVSVLLSVDDQAFLSHLADFIESRGVSNEEDMGIGGTPSSRISKDILSTIRSAAIYQNSDIARKVEIGSGLGAHLRDLLVEGIRLVPREGWYESAETADAIAAKMILAYGTAMSESAQTGDREEMKNIYRAGLGLPVVLEQLKVDQCAIAAREAVAFAQTVGLKVRVEGSLSGEGPEPALDIANALQGSEDPTILFVDMKTGGRPNGQIGSVVIYRLGTFFSSYRVTYDRDRMIADNLQDAATLREALIKVGKERLSVFKQGSSRNELVPYARYISRSLTRDKDVKVADLIADLTRSDPATPVKKLLARAMKTPDPSAAFTKESEVANNEYVAEFCRVLSLATSPTTPLAKIEQALDNFAEEMTRHSSVG